MTAQHPTPQGRCGGWCGGGQREQELENANEQLTVTITVRVRSPPVKCELVQQFSRQERLFDVALDTKKAPAHQMLT